MGKLVASAGDSRERQSQAAPRNRSASRGSAQSVSQAPITAVHCVLQSGGTSAQAAGETEGGERERAQGSADHTLARRRPETRSTRRSQAARKAVATGKPKYRSAKLKDCWQDELVAWQSKQSTAAAASAGSASNGATPTPSPANIWSENTTAKQATSADDAIDETEDDVEAQIAAATRRAQMHGRNSSRASAADEKSLLAADASESDSKESEAAAAAAAAAARPIRQNATIKVNFTKQQLRTPAREEKDAEMLAKINAADAKHQLAQQKANPDAKDAGEQSAIFLKDKGSTRAAR